MAPAPCASGGAWPETSLPSQGPDRFLGATKQRALAPAGCPHPLPCRQVWSCTPGFGRYPQATGKGLGTLTGQGSPLSQWQVLGSGVATVSPGWQGAVRPGPAAGQSLSRGSRAGPHPQALAGFARDRSQKAGPLKACCGAHCPPTPWAPRAPSAPQGLPWGTPPCTHAEPASKEPPQCICLRAAGVSTRPSAAAPSQHGRWACLPVAGHIVLEPSSPSPWRWGGRGRPASPQSLWLLQDHGAAHGFQGRLDLLRLGLHHVGFDFLRQRLHQLLGLWGQRGQDAGAGVRMQGGGAGHRQSGQGRAPVVVSVPTCTRLMPWM